MEVETKREGRPVDSLILSVQNVNKNFGGVAALRDMLLDVRENEIVGLMGPNGAGKTVLLNVISGQYKTSSGKILFKQCDITAMAPHQICRLGIGKTYQIPQPYTNLTVMQNLMIPAMYGRGLNKAEAEKHAIELLQFTALSDRKDVLARDLSTVILRRLELARALASQPSLLLLDEVMAGLTPEEMSTMMELLREIHKRGVTILLIEHVIEAIVEMADRIVVMDKGTKIAEGKPKDIVQSAVVIETYLG